MITKRVKKRKQYWWDIIYGGLLTFIIIYVAGFLVLSKLNLEYFYSYYFYFCLCIVIYYQWSDDNYNAIDSKFSKSENSEIAKNVLDRLNWKYKVYPTGIQVINKKSVLNFLNICIIPDDEIIYYNFQYRSFVLIGRFPFFLGILTLTRRKFFKQLQNEILQESQELQGLELDRSRN